MTLPLVNSLGDRIADLFNRAFAFFDLGEERIGESRYPPVKKEDGHSAQGVWAYTDYPSGEEGVAVYTTDEFGGPDQPVVRVAMEPNDMLLLGNDLINRALTAKGIKHSSNLEDE